MRYIDNFSSGTRGSASAEYFLKQGYAVIFLHRRGSLEPYKRHFTQINFLDLITTQGVEAHDLRVDSDHAEKVSKIAKDYCNYKENLFNIPFTALNDYLHWLRAAAEELGKYDQKVVFYLAAAVSDFYIPADQMPEHKIQSSEGELQLSLKLVPKMLAPLVSAWAPKAYVASFKLETDPNMLIPKAKGALEKYSHQLVIGNLLERRKKEVILVSREDEKPIILTEQEIDEGKEIEKELVAEVKQRHEKYIKMNATTQ